MNCSKKCIPAEIQYYGAVVVFEAQFTYSIFLKTLLKTAKYQLQKFGRSTIFVTNVLAIIRQRMSIKILFD